MPRKTKAEQPRPRQESATQTPVCRPRPRPKQHPVATKPPGRPTLHACWGSSLAQAAARSSSIAIATDAECTEALQTSESRQAEAKPPEIESEEKAVHVPAPTGTGGQEAISTVAAETAETEDQEALPQQTSILWDAQSGEYSRCKLKQRTNRCQAVFAVCAVGNEECQAFRAHGPGSARRA